MLKKIIFSIIAVLFIIIISKTTFSNEVISKISVNSTQPNISVNYLLQQNDVSGFYDGHHRRHRGPFYFYYTEPIHFRHFGHRHRENERHERHERHEHHEKHEGHHNGHHRH